jgi:Flp pilus assembly pilin Flp
MIIEASERAAVPAATRHAQRASAITRRVRIEEPLSANGCLEPAAPQIPPHGLTRAGDTLAGGIASSAYPRSFGPGCRDKTMPNDVAPVLHGPDDEEVETRVMLSLTRYWWSLRREEGQTMAEYAVILSVISVIVIGAVLALSGGIGDALDKVTDVITGSGETTTP